MPKKTLRTMMILMVWGGCALLFMTAMSVDFIFSKDKVENTIEQNAMNQARYYATKMDMLFAETAQVPKMMAINLNDAYQNVDDESNEQALSSYLRRILELSPDIYGIGIAFEPGAFSSKTKVFGPYYNYEKDKIVYCQMGDPADPNYVNYFEKHWYLDAKKCGYPVWSEPYLDQVLMITYSYPLYRNKQFIGVIIVDISLESISQAISQIKLLETGYSFAISKNGALLSSLDGHSVLEQNINDLNPELGRQIREIKKIPSEECLVVKTRGLIRQKPSLIVVRPVSHAEGVVGSVGFVYPLDEINAVIYDMRKESTIVGLVGLFLLLIVVVTVSNTLSKPISTMAEIVTRVSQGNLDYKLDVLSSISEVLVLQSSFNKMSDDLKLYVQELKATVAARERIESELKVARDIQASMLPRIFPPFPDRCEFNIYATMEPAKEVGGDFYDFFFITPDKLCFLIGDVSGKGIPAALFMVITKALLRMEAMNNITADKILSRVNNLLYPDNNELMFVTVFCAILDMNTGELDCANAGHNPPMLCRAAGKDNKYERININKNIVLGIMPDSKFLPDRLKMEPEDIIFLYTDGVTEAMNNDSKQFSESHLQHILTEAKSNDIVSMVHMVHDEILVFADGAPQSDDITMLAVKYNGKNSAVS